MLRQERPEPVLRFVAVVLRADHIACTDPKFEPVSDANDIAKADGVGVIIWRWRGMLQLFPLGNRHITILFI